MGNVLRAGRVPVLSPELLTLFGADDDPMERLEARARAMFPDSPPIVWECDACSFKFAYVGEAAGALGYPLQRWLEPGFWAGHIVIDDDRDDAVTYCSLATAKACDHMFEYRARTIDGRTLWLRDFVKVVAGADGAAKKLRGVMFDVTAEKSAQPFAAPARLPSRDELVA